MFIYVLYICDDCVGNMLGRRGVNKGRRGFQLRKMGMYPVKTTGPAVTNSPQVNTRPLVWVCTSGLCTFELRTEWLENSGDSGAWWHTVECTTWRLLFLKTLTVWVLTCWVGYWPWWSRGGHTGWLRGCTPCPRGTGWCTSPHPWYTGWTCRRRGGGGSTAVGRGYVGRGYRRSTTCLSEPKQKVQEKLSQA